MTTNATATVVSASSGINPPPAARAPADADEIKIIDRRDFYQKRRDEERQMLRLVQQETNVLKKEALALEREKLLLLREHNRLLQENNRLLEQMVKAAHNHAG